MMLCVKRNKKMLITKKNNNIRFIRAGAVSEHRVTTTRKEDNSARNCNSRFSNIEGDKEVKVTACSFKLSFICIHEVKR